MSNMAAASLLALLLRSASSRPIRLFADGRACGTAMNDDDEHDDDDDASLLQQVWAKSANES
jgi:hypothetical protein